MFKRFSMVALLAIPGVAAADDLRCPEVEAPPASVCVATPYGPAYADTEVEANRAADALGDSAQRYALHFGRAPSGTLILSTHLDPLVARDFARAHGLDYAQVWLPAAAKRTMTERAMRQAGVDRAGITRALAGAAEREVVTLRHEVGHALYAAMYWPDAAESSLQARYGTPATDDGVFPGLDSFYGQSLLLALFLVETSGEPRILVPISAAIAGGATFDQWLAADGGAHGLPNDVPALQTLWEGWLKSQVLQRGRGGKG